MLSWRSGIGVAAVAFIALRTHAVELEPRLRAEVGAGADSNVIRGFEDSAGNVRPDLLLGFLLHGQATIVGQRASLRASLSEGARLFVSSRPADVLASQLDLDGRLVLGERTALTLDALGKDLTERAQFRDHLILRGSAGIEQRLAETFILRLYGGHGVFYPHGALYANYLSAGAHAGLRARLPFSRRHGASAGYELGERRFPQWVTKDRYDLGQQGSLGYQYRGPVVLGADYLVSYNRSNVPGGAYLGHRVTGRGAFALPADVTLAAQLAIQFFDFRGGIPEQSQREVLRYREDLQNNAELKVSRPFSESLQSWELSIRAGYYRNKLPGAPPLEFNRGVVLAGISWRSDAE